MTTLTELAAMLDAATGPERELDRLLATTLFPRGNCFAPNGDCLDWLDLHEPEITNSIDAALALVGRLLPGWAYQIGQDYIDCFPTEYFVCRLAPERATDWSSSRVLAESAPTAPLAILKALVAALIAKEKNDEA